MNSNRDLNYRLYLQREHDFKRTDFSSEFETYSLIRDGEEDKVRERFKKISKDFQNGKGELSDNPLRNNIYHLVVAAGVIARICTEGGMQHNIAYTLSDVYIRKADKCTVPEDVIDLIGEMQIDFAQRMREIRQNKVYSIHVRRCLNYIYDHLHEQVTLEKLAEVEKLSCCYLSKIFSKETGVPVKRFIVTAKVNTAKNMLIYSDFTLSEIAMSLGFSSQSALSAAFKKVTGQTPAKFRNMYREKAEE
ncbi:MAG: AraC family transcriptional regulator [Ruminococcus flavefaciens]|nr:AraC family transcriptional regulator [Ruminococcus flavefaciens]